MKSKEYPAPRRYVTAFTFEGVPGISLMPCLKSALCKAENEEKKASKRLIQTIFWGLEFVMSLCVASLITRVEKPVRQEIMPGVYTLMEPRDQLTTLSANGQSIS